MRNKGGEGESTVATGGTLVVGSVHACESRAGEENSVCAPVATQMQERTQFVLSPDLLGHAALSSTPICCTLSQLHMPKEKLEYNEMITKKIANPSKYN